MLFLDQDDKIADNYLGEQLRTIGQADAVVCDSSVFVRQYSALCKLIERTDLLRDAPIQQLVSDSRRLKR